MKKGARWLLGKIQSFLLKDIANRNEVNSILLAKLHIHKIRKLKQIDSLREVEFKVFSQWGEDRIIQYLIEK